METIRSRGFGILGFVLLASLLVACASEEAKPPAAAPAAKPAAVPSSPAPVAQPAAKPVAPKPVASAPKPAPVNPLNDPGHILSKRSIFYDYDEATIKPDYRALVEAHAKYIREHPGASVVVEGNCDERGSREYNLALGQRRAESLKNMLVLLGAPASQIEPVSLGEEKPRANGHNAQAWSQNRRSDIIYRRIQ